MAVPLRPDMGVRSGSLGDSWRVLIIQVIVLMGDINSGLNLN